MDFSKLAEPFKESDIEWRVQSCRNSDKGPWARVLAYVTNRAIQNRLDEVCTPAGWQNEYKAAPCGGVMCGISILCNGEWITKWDGAENTDIEQVKGGLSDSMKRAAVQWGIGRYLYNLDADYAVISDKGKYYHDDKKQGVKFRWNPPKLPAWALPSGHNQQTESSRHSEESLHQQETPLPELERKMNIVLDIINSGKVQGAWLKEAETIYDSKNESRADGLIHWYKTTFNGE